MREALEGLKGIRKVEVSFEKRQAAVQFDDQGDLSLDDVFNALQRLGYRASAL